MMKPLSFKITSDHLLLCVFLSLLWGVTDSNTTSTPDTTLTTTTVTSSTEAKTTTVLLTTPLTTLSQTKPPPLNAKGFQSVGQNETSITLQWKKVDDILNYTLVFSEREINITASAGHQVTYTVSDLTNMTKYDFTLFTVSENVRSSGVNTTAFTAPPNAKGFQSVGQNETSITLQWKKMDDILKYTLVFSEREINVTASAGHEQVTHTISGLTSGTKYDFSLFALFENVRSSGVNYNAVTAPHNAEELETVGQNETSITLQWKKVDAILKYTLVFNESEINVTASAGHEQVTHTISGLTSGTKYNFSLFALFENVRSSGVNYNAVTAPRNAKELETVGQNETSITLQWKKVDDILKYTLVFSEREINVTASAGHEQVTHTISGLTSGTKYDFSLFALFENVRSSGVNYNAVTAPHNAEELETVGQNETSITLQWKKVDAILKYTLVFNESEINVTASAGHEQVTHTISGLTSGTKYNFSLFALFENVRSSGVNYNAVTAPRNAKELETVGQNETSITLQWKKVDDILQYTLVFSEREINVTASAGHEQVTHTISGLTSGTKYNFSLFALFENVRSSGVNYNAVTAPRNAKELETVGQNETSITLQWKKVDDILKYTLVFSEREINVTASAGHEQVTHTISGLTSGTKYDFSLFALFENVRSSGVNYNAVTAPENVKIVTVLTQNESSITLMWEKVNSISTYILQNDNGSPIKGKRNAFYKEASVTLEVSSLTAGRKYNFTLITVFEKVNSTGYTFNAVTVPSVVALVNVTERSVTSITLAWNVDVDKDWSYFLQMNGEHLLYPNSSTNVSRSFTSLQPGTEYPFSVITMFSGLNSTAYKDFTVTAIDCTSVTWHVTNSSIQGMIEGLFTNATASNKSQTHVSPEGRNVSFTGLYPGETYEVSLVYERNSKRFQQCSHKLTIIPPDLSAHCEYWAAGYSIFIVWNKPDGVWTAVEVNVTGKTYEVDAIGEQHIKIPGFLPAKTYKVSLASLSGTVRSYKRLVFSCRTDPRGVIAGSVFAVLLFGVLVCLAVFILLKRPDIISRKKPFIGGSKPFNKKCKAISVAKFPDHFYQLSVDENIGFSQEYESLIPVGTEQTQKEALLPENKARNRFNNVLPYDWCRVKLTTSNPNGTSEYINASYMPGYNSNREYIATQGPLPSTVNDFWRMIWEQRVKGIVMVTNCTEGGRTKCERYWPADSKPCLYGELLVTNRSEQQELNWTLREFRMKHRNTSEARTLKHFHFTAWPDHGVPQGTEVLIQFRGLVRQHIEREGAGAPTVVHCSAGVGRTGTIIALDVLLQQLEKERAVGINAFVHKMRLSRPHMVQTESQYVFLHQCIMDCLQPNEKTEENIYENADMIYVNATALRELH